MFQKLLMNINTILSDGTGGFKMSGTIGGYKSKPKQTSNQVNNTNIICITFKCRRSNTLSIRI